MRPWATGTRSAKFAERWSTLATLPDEVLERLAPVRASVGPDGLLPAPHLP